jgi:hypothetical protein
VPIILPSVAALADLDDIIECLAPWYHLYVNNLTPTYDTTLADFTEASFPGYETTEATGWTPAVWIEPFAVTYADGIKWVLSESIPPVKVYGYYVTSGEAGHLCWCELREDGPITLQTMGDSVTLTPNLTLCQCLNPAPLSWTWPYPVPPLKRHNWASGSDTMPPPCDKG